MAKSDSDQKASTAQNRQGTLQGFTDLNTGLQHDDEGNIVVPEVNIPKGERVIQQDQIGAFRRTVFSNGAVETVQTEPANTGGGEIQTPVPLPGEKQDVTGTGQDAAYQPKTASDSKTGAAAEKAAQPAK